MGLSGTIQDTATPFLRHSHLDLSPVFCRCKEEARRACRAGKKQLVSFPLSPAVVCLCLGLAVGGGAPAVQRGAWGTKGNVCRWSRHHSLRWSYHLRKPCFPGPLARLTKSPCPPGTEVSQGQATDREAHRGPPCQAGHCSRHPGPDLCLPDRPDGSHCPSAPVSGWSLWHTLLILPTVAVPFGRGPGFFRVVLGACFSCWEVLASVNMG